MQVVKTAGGARYLYAVEEVFNSHAGGVADGVTVTGFLCFSLKEQRPEREGMSKCDTL